MKTGYGLTREQRQLLSGNQIQAMNLLNMCNAQLSVFLNQEYLENPLLDCEGGSTVPGSAQEFDSWYFKDQNLNEGYGHGDKEERISREYRPVQDERELENYIKDQLNMKKYSSTEWEFIHFLICNLDEGGFYKTSAQETAKLAGVSKETAEKCLADLRQLEPAGIFAADLKECLLRQLEVLGVKEEKLEEIIRSHLDEALGGKISKITRSLGISSVQARKYLAFIGTLNPRPLTGFFKEDNSYVIPDVVISRRGDSWEIVLNDEWIGDYHLNEYYLKMIPQCQDEELLKYFTAKLERARFIMSSVERRRQMILSVAESVFAHQREFFEGRGEKKPWTMAQTASELGVHPSTVSRAVSGKYVQYPTGTVLMKDLFTASAGQSDDDMTAEEIKGILQALIKTEKAEKPYSDQELAELLKKQGITVSRRTVAKYREELGILTSYLRKTYNR